MNSFSIIVNRSSPSYGEFGIMTLNYDNSGISRPTQNGQAGNKLGLPDTVKAVQLNGEKDWVFLTKDMQLWMHNLCWKRSPSMSEVEAKLSWRSLMNGGGGEEGSQMSARAFSDYAGSETNYDFVNEKNTDKEPIKMKTIITGGSFVKKLSIEKINSTKVVRVAAINPLSNFKNLTPKSHPHLFFFPTISRREHILDTKSGKPSGKYIEWLSIPFPQYKDNSVLPIWALPGQDYIFLPYDRFKQTDKPINPFRNIPGKYQYPNPYA